jgi:carbon-monoxide dehydrogenase catalytic subunit
MAEARPVSVDKATLEAYEKAKSDGVETVFDRAARIKPCPIGAGGACCKNCGMGPCRVPAPKNREETAEEKAKRTGVCGATAETIAARNFGRMVAAGAAAHSDHARGVALTFLEAAKGELKDFTIKDEQKLYQLAMDLDIEIEDKETQQIAIEVGEKCLADFGKQEGEGLFIKRAPLKRQEIWRNLGIVPRGVDREIVEMMHRTHIGVDQDYENILMHAARTSLADGWGGSMISTELQDVIFGTPEPVAGKVNLGILKKDEVNIIIHGHEPLLPEMMVIASQEPEILKYAESKGAKGINLGGLCCSANEVLMRHGIPVAGNFLQQELAITTGAVELMTVDVQCQMESLYQVSTCYHTKLITTDRRAKIEGAQHIPFEEEKGLEIARDILKIAIDNFANRDQAKVLIPDETQEMVVGFSHETINYLLGGMFRASYRPLNDNIINGRIRGVAGVVGCNNARVQHNYNFLAMIKELIKNDVLVLTTGCSSMAAGEAGLMTPEAALEFAGDGLKSVCEAVGIPPVLHMGSCVDNSRILMAATAMVKDGGLGDDISDLPAAGAAPEWMSEKAISIGEYFVASGVYTVFGATWPTTNSKKVTDYLFEKYEDTLKGMWGFEEDPVKAAQMMIAHIDKKRKELGIDKARERILYDMEKRRELDAA